MLTSHPRTAITTACLLLTLLTLTEAAKAESQRFQPPIPPPQTSVIDRSALHALRKSIRPSASLLPSWLSNDPCADAWEGVVCSPTGRVIQLFILGKSGTVEINHSLPADLGNLSALTNLTLSSLGFSGQIPSELGNLRNLTHLDLQRNRLAGPIPATLGRLSQLSELYLNDNSLSECLDPELFRQFARTGCQLQRLHLNHNNLTGPVPLEIASLTGAGARLDTIFLSNNGLSGLLPPPIFTMDVRMNIANNSLSGSVPADISWRADGTDLSGNLFSGNFPAGFPPKAVAGNCFAAERQRDSRECALAYPGVQCGCRPPQVTGIAGLCRCVVPLQLRAVFTANRSEALGGFLLDLQGALDRIARAASMGSRQVVLVNFSTTPVPPAVELWLNLLPATGTALAADQRAAIEKALGGRTNVYFTSGFWLSKIDFIPDSPSTPETVGPSASPLNPSAQPGPQPDRPLAPSTPSRRSAGGISSGVEIAGTSLAILLVAGLGAGFALCLWRSSCKTECVTTPETSLKSWTLSELKAATNNFKDTNIVGVGGFGVVYRGNLAGTTVAIKRLKVWSSHGWDEFLKEQTTVGSIDNRNLVMLRGYCVEAGERLLVYDFMARGSLEDALFKSEGTQPLTWSQCLNILMGTAQAIAHLHRKKIIHRDIKPANVLLDQNFEARVSDFGLSRCTPVTSTRQSPRLKGTMGYMAPEYAHTGHLTEKSDVYSTGMVMLVVISHHRPYNLFEIDGRGIVLPIRAFVLAQENRLADLVAPRFANTCNEHEARRFIAVALLCIHPSWQLRPTMGEVVQMLSGHMDIPPMDMRTIDIILSYESYGAGSDSGGSMGR